MSDKTPLEERIPLIVIGQVTWPEPKLGKSCFDCSYFTTNPGETHRNTLPEGKGICRRCYEVAPKGKPSPFKGTATACPQIEPFKK